MKKETLTIKVPLEMKEEIEAVAHIAKMKPESVIRLALAIQMRKWEKAGGPE